MLKNFLVNNLTFIGKYKRFLVALWAHLSSIKPSYSQHKEDRYIWNLLQNYDLAGSVFVDIGANHPTDISNTYLLYRNGLRGIIVEPNEELICLFRRFRKRDTTLMIGCSNITGVLKFNISKTPVVSSFSGDRDVNVYKSVYLPVMPIDAALQNLEFEYISLLSIDVEGLNYEVLQGAATTIQRSLIVCIEYDSEQEKSKIEILLNEDFEFLCKFDCNILYINKKMSDQKLLNKQ